MPSTVVYRVPECLKMLAPKPPKSSEMPSAVIYMVLAKPKVLHTNPPKDIAIYRKFGKY